MIYEKLLYGDLVKFIVEFQNQNGRNIQYNNFLFEMGNWSADPGFNAESNDQFSKIVNNSKKPVNAYYKYNDKIIRHLCSIVDNDVSIFPIDIQKRNELMSVIVERFFKNANSNNKYVKIKEYYSNKDFENFMIEVFDFAHFNSVNYFNEKRKKEYSLNEESKDITGQGYLEQTNDCCNFFSEGKPEKLTDNIIKAPGVNDNEPEKYSTVKAKRNFSIFNVKKKNVSNIAKLTLVIITGIFLFISRNAGDPQASPAAKEPKLDSTQLHVPVNDEIDSDISPPVNNKKEQDTAKNISVNKDGRITQNNSGLSAVTSKDKKVKKQGTKKNQEKKVEEEHKLTVKKGENKSQKNSESEKKDIAAGTNITINGSGVFVIGDKNIVNVH